MIVRLQDLKHKENVKIHDPKNFSFISEISNKLFSTEIECFWKINSSSTRESYQENLLTSLEKLVLEILEKSSSFKEGHFEVTLVWKNKNPNLSNN